MTDKEEFPNDWRVLNLEDAIVIPIKRGYITEWVAYFHHDDSMPVEQPKPALQEALRNIKDLIPKRKEAAK